MHRAACDLSGREAYFLLVDSIVPRPVAWVSSRSRSGVGNLAPFSFFMGVSSRPPILALSLAKRIRSEGPPRFAEKDTLQNIRETGEFVVHLAPAQRQEEVLRTGEPHAPEIDESALIGLDSVAGSWVDVPRFPGLPIAMECRLHQLIPLGEPTTHLVLGEVLGWHVWDQLLDHEGRIWAERWHPLARLGVDRFAPDAFAASRGPDDSER